MTCAYNIALKSQEERRHIELDKQAAEVIYKLRKKDVDRYQIECRIAAMSADDQRYFRVRLNHYQDMRNGRLQK